MSKKIKELELSALRKSIGGVKDFVILEPLKVDAATDFEFRKKLREKKCKVQLVKNSLARKIFEEGGLKVDAWSGPTLLIWGDSDAISPVAVGRHLVQRLPNARLEIVPGGDHDVASTHADHVARLIALHLG